MGKKEENDHEAKERLLGDDVNPQVEPADK